MSKKKEPVVNEKPPIQFPVVGIGASAGGLEAVRQFLLAVPEKSGMAYVFVQHLSPNHESALPEILKKFAKIPVEQIEDNIHLQPDHFYIIPANRIVTATDGVLKLAPLNSKAKVIDLFFSSIAVVHQSFAVGVVLSGMLDDGTLGLQVIKAYGGLTFAQDEASAAFDAMPKSARQKGVVDFVLPPAQIVERLIAINHPFHPDYSPQKTTGKTTRQDEDILKQLLTVLRVRRGVDFTYYKTGTIKRRIIRRMALNRMEKPEEYLALLRENKQEQDALYNDMLISVTNFFRDIAGFDLLCDTIFPELIKQKKNNEALRIWVAGCATGEEAYSMAICLHEYLGDKTAALKIQIFATDISETAIAKARAGIYRPTDVEGLSASRLQQFFTKLDGSYQVNKSIRDICVFAHHNLLKDPPFSRLDLVSCRNVLIYLEPVLQKRALTTFHYALNDHGFLMLGKSEGVSNSVELFSAYSSQEKIFSRKGERGRFMQVTSAGNEQSFQDLDKNIQAENGKQDVFKLAGDLILSRYAPASVLVNDRFDIVQFIGKTEPWLALPGGKASFNLMKMAREGLAFELRNLLHRVKKTNVATRKEGILFKLENRQEYVNIEVAMVSKATEPHYLILFEKAHKGEQSPVDHSHKGKDKGPDARDQELEQLQNELMQVRADMRTVTDEQEVANEELMSANQELLSGSEELQSLNEELETSREELQSTNEEITIVNTELTERNDQLNTARNYTEGIINTVRDALIILDKELKVLRATESFYHKFKVTEKETEGHFFYELGNRQWDIPAFRDLLENIINEHKEVIDYEVTHIFPVIGRKVMHLNARQLDKVNGEQVILLAIEDITMQRMVEEGLAETEQLLKEHQYRLKLAVDAAELGTWDYHPQTGELVVDNRCKALFGLLPADEVKYEEYIAIISEEDREQANEKLKSVLAGDNNGTFENEFRVEGRDKQKRWIRSKGQAFFDADGRANRFVGTALDITAQKRHEEGIKELLKKKDDFISIASHELKTPFTTLKSSLQLLDKMKNDPSAKMLPNLIDKANRSMVKINTLIEDLLDVSKFGQGQLILHKERFTIAQIINECCDHVAATGFYSIKTEGEMHMEITGDLERIEQVVVNLVNNAMKYAPESPEIRLITEKLDNFAKISVGDRGPGISPEKLPHIFDRYYRADSSGKQYSGLGLGLYISAEIVKKHGGEIGVDSEPEKGSTFWFTLPLSV